MEIMSTGIVGIITAVICVFIFSKFLSLAVFPLVGNIIAGGILYYILDAFSIIPMQWSVFDAIVIAIFGIPGTIFIALLRLFF